MMQRKLAGSLSHLSPETLLRLLTAAGASGVLEIRTEDDVVRLEIVRGIMEPPAPDDAARIRSILLSGEGQFRFEPGNAAAKPPEGGISVLSLADVAVAGRKKSSQAQLSSEFDVEELLEEGGVLSAPPAEPKIHLLSVDVPENPLDDLLGELEAIAPEELLFAQIGLVASDPRFWTNALERVWRQRGWQMRRFEDAAAIPLDELDVLIVHQQLSVSRSGGEDAWIDVLERARSASPPVPSLWIGPVGNPVWVHRLVTAGVAFLLPAPQSDSGEPLRRFQDAVTTIVGRQLMMRTSLESGTARLAESELLDVLLHGQEEGQGLSVLLQLAAGTLQKAAVLGIEETAIRCRAGFGYPLERGRPVAPRGIGVIERTLRARTPLLSLDPVSAGAAQLARLLGVDRLPRETVLIPLCMGPAVTGLLIGDRRGAPLEALEELSTLATRMGGVLIET